MKSKENHDKIILSSGKSTSVNQILKFILHKYKIDFNFKNNKKKNANVLIGNNNFAKKVLKWSHKKNIFIAADEILKSIKANEQ